MNPFFSIVTVCLNPGYDLERTVSSVLSQKFTNYEYIIKDGLSTDESLDRLQLTSRCVTIRCKDSGIYDAMNQAVFFTKGKYILFLNSGDLFYDENVLTHFHNSIIKNKYPALVYSDLIPTRTDKPILYPDYLSDFFLFRSMICHQTWMIRVDTSKDGIMFNPKYQLFGDYDLLLRIVLNSTSTYLHIRKIGIIYKSIGFSSRNYGKFKEEFTEIQKLHFKNKYYLYKFIHMLTFPKFRRFLKNIFF